MSEFLWGDRSSLPSPTGAGLVITRCDSFAVFNDRLMQRRSCSLMTSLGLFLVRQAVKAKKNRLPNHSSIGLSNKPDIFFSSSKFFNMWRPSGAMWYSLAINPPPPLLAASFHELNQTLRSGGISPALRRPPGFFFPPSRKGRGPARGRGQTLSRPGAPGGL